MAEIEFLPEWARIVAVFIIILFGAGGFARVLTIFISSKKIDDNDPIKNEVVVDKPEHEIISSINNEIISSINENYDDLIEHLEKRLDRSERESKALKREYEADIQDIKREHEKYKNDIQLKLDKLQWQVDKQTNDIYNAKLEMHNLRIYISIIRDQWVLLTDKPFPVNPTTNI